MSPCDERGTTLSQGHLRPVMRPWGVDGNREGSDDEASLQSHTSVYAPRGEVDDVDGNTGWISRCNVFQGGAARYHHLPVDVPGAMAPGNSRSQLPPDECVPLPLSLASCSKRKTAPDAQQLKPTLRSGADTTSQGAVSECCSIVLPLSSLQHHPGNDDQGHAGCTRTKPLIFREWNGGAVLEGAQCEVITEVGGPHEKAAVDSSLSDVASTFVAPPMRSTSRNSLTFSHQGGSDIQQPQRTDDGVCPARSRSSAESQYRVVADNDAHSEAMTFEPLASNVAGRFATDYRRQESPQIQASHPGDPQPTCENSGMLFSHMSISSAEDEHLSQGQDIDQESMAPPLSSGRGRAQAARGQEGHPRALHFREWQGQAYSLNVQRHVACH